MIRFNYRVIIGLIITLVGLIILVTPSIIRYQNERAKVIILENAREHSQNSTETNPRDLDHPKAPKSIIQSSDDDKSEMIQPIEVYNNLDSQYDDILGIIKINKIDLELPVFSNFSDDNLDIAPCVMEESSQIGEIGNLSIAGHRSYTYGRQFNRLDEVQINDSIIIESDGIRYSYNVNDVFTVEPEEVWVLDGNGEESVLTLITCTPVRVATHRLIIKGKLISAEPIKD